MKSIKTLALMLVALVGMTACSNDDDEQKKFIIDPVEGLSGYIFVTSGYFTDSYYGNDATVSVTGNKNQYNISFHDPQWGDVTFENVELDEAHGTVSGSGKLSMNYRGKPGTYDATLSGDMKNLIITMPEVMKGKANGEKGTIISFYPGEAPLACELNGSHSGTNNITVGRVTYPADITYKVTANPDGSINLSLPEYQVEGTPMGDLTLGAYTLKNIPYDKEKGAFYRLYGEGVKEHLKAVKDGNTTIDDEYDLDEEGFIQVEKTENGIKVTNSFQPIPMPFAIQAVFETAAK